MKGRTIALSAVSAAICVIFLTIGEFLPTLSLGSAFLAGVVVMVPLSKRSYGGAALCVIAAALITMMITGFVRFEAILPFASFFGLQPILNKVQSERNWNRYILLAVKDVWFVGVAVAYYFIFNMAFFENNEALNRYALPIIIVGAAAGYVLYDFLAFYFQKYIDITVKRLKL